MGKSMRGFGRDSRASKLFGMRVILIFFPIIPFDPSDLFSSSFSYLISRCNVWRRKNLLYFIFSIRPCVRRLFLVVIYRLGGLPSFRASVHSRMTISLGISLSYFFLFYSSRSEMSTSGSFSVGSSSVVRLELMGTCPRLANRRG